MKKLLFDDGWISLGFPVVALLIFAWAAGKDGPGWVLAGVRDSDAIAVSFVVLLCCFIGAVLEVFR